MSDPLILQLERIGWKHLNSLGPFTQKRLLRRLTESVSSKTSPHQARDDLKALKHIVDAANDFLVGVRTANPTLKEAIEWSTWVTNGQRVGPFDEVAVEAMSALEKMLPGLTGLQAQLEERASALKRGRRRNTAAYNAAKVLAEIYILCLGKRPSYGRKGITKGSSTLFCDVAEKVFRILGLKVGEVVDQCEAAVKGTSAEELEGLLRRRSLGMIHEPPSLFDLF